MEKFDTSLFEPLKIEINGKVYEVAPVDRRMSVEMAKLDQAWGDGDLESPYKRLDILLGKHEELDKLPITEVFKIIQSIIRMAYGLTGTAVKDKEDQKKAGGPGESQ
jgi:hypothetical protein